MLLRTTPDRRPLAAHIWAKEEHGFYIEPEWCSERLFEVEKFNGAIWDPASGIGRVAEAARRAGYRTIATDMVDRGYPRLDACVDFLLRVSSRPEHRLQSAVRSLRSIRSARPPPSWRKSCDDLARAPAERCALAGKHTAGPRLSIDAATLDAAGACDCCWREARRRNSGFLLADLFPQAQRTANAALALP